LPILLSFLSTPTEIEAGCERLPPVLLGKLPEPKGTIAKEIPERKGKQEKNKEKTHIFLICTWKTR